MTEALRSLILLPPGCARIAAAVPDEIVVDWAMLGVAVAAALMALAVVAVAWRRA